MSKQTTLRMMVIATVAAIALAAGSIAVARTEPVDSGIALRERLAKLSELSGFASVMCPSVVNDAYRFAGRFSSSESLQRNGFVAGLAQPLYSQSRRAQAVTSVAEFASATGAAAEAKAEADAARTGSARYTAFAVSGVSDAYGFTITWGTTIERDVVFTAGRYVYAVAVSFRTTSRTPVTAAWLAAAAREALRG
jgi:hypothetical protein